MRSGVSKSKVGSGTEMPNVENRATRNWFQHMNVWILLTTIQAFNIIIYGIQKLRFKHYCCIDFMEGRKFHLTVGKVNKKTGAIIESTNVMLSEEEFLLIASLLNYSSKPWVTFIVYCEPSRKTVWFPFPGWVVGLLRRDMVSIIIANRYSNFRDRQISLN